MKNRNIVLFILFLATTYLFSQENLIRIPTNLKITNSAEILHIIDNSNNLHFFIFSDRAMKYFKVDENFNVVFEKKYPEPTRLSNILGSGVDADNAVNIYFTDNKFNTVFCLTIQENGQLSTKSLDFRLKREQLLNIVDTKDNLHILSFTNNTSEINRYSFSGREFTKTVYDLTDERFYSHENELTTLWRILTNDDSSIIESGLPTSLDISSKLIKIYPTESDLILSLDHRDSATRVFYLSLSDNTYKIDHYNISTFPFGKTEYLKSNSFIYDDNIYQAIASYDLFHLSVKNLATHTLVKEFSFTDEGEITFANTPIFNEELTSGTSNGELNSSKQFLRKITNIGNVGISAYEKDAVINLSVGGVREQISPTIMPMFIVGSVGGSIAGGFTFNPPTFMNQSLMSYYSYTSSNAVYIKSLFDKKSLNHLEGEVMNNVFDKIKDYSDELENTELTTIFKYLDYFVYGYYNSEENQYQLLKFEP